jgi:hypothetical protein
MQDNQQFQLTELKARLFDAQEDIKLLNSVLQQVSQITQFEGNTLDDLLAHLTSIMAKAQETNTEESGE